jgi:nitroreductase
MAEPARAAARPRRLALPTPAGIARRFFALAGPLADLWYALFDRAFSREHRAVLAGIETYHAIERAGGANRYMLRRNTHRLEKGLIMRPRRPNFALDYVGDTLDMYGRCVADHHVNPGDAGELRWAHDVLAEYFAVSAPHPVVDALRERFVAMPTVDDPAAGPTPATPYLRDLSAPAPVGYHDFLALARRRRSVRWFRQEPVPRALIDQAITAAAESPSACNRQPFVFRVFDDPERVKRVAELPMGTRGFSGNIPAVVVVVGQLRAYFSPRDRHLIYIDGSLAAMSFMLALETLGLSSCPINWPDIAAREKRMARELGLEPDQRAVMLIAVGYPDEQGAVAYSQKRSLDTLRSYNS